MRFKIAIVFACLLMPVAVEAKPSPYHAVEFSGDRYIAPVPVAQKRPVVRHSRHAKVRYFYRVKRAPAGRARQRGYVAPLTLAQGMGREFGRALGRPRAWCGWWLGQHLGMPDRKLWLARNWASVGHNAGGPRVGAVVVWRHHVGIITGRSGDRWVVKSGNDGHRVRERPRSLARAIAFRIAG
jgi:hypothetical protein